MVLWRVPMKMLHRVFLPFLWRILSSLTLFDGASEQHLLEEWAMDVSTSPNMMAYLAWFYFIHSIAQCTLSPTKLSSMGLWTSNTVAKSIMDVSKLRPEDYKGGSAVHKALKTVCPHTRLKVTHLLLPWDHTKNSRRIPLVLGAVFVPWGRP